MTSQGDDAQVRFYRFKESDRLRVFPDRAQDAQVRLWRPGDAAPGPGSFMGREHHIFLIFHRLGVFSNRDYSALCLDDGTGRLLHISCIFPRFFRFPFMGRDDLQIGATHTASDARGQGLAQRGLIEAVQRLARPGRAFWYLTDAANKASCSVAEKAGFKLAGYGARTPRLGIGALSAYRLTQPNPGVDWE